MTLTKDFLKESLFLKYCKGKRVLPIILISVFSPFAVYSLGYCLIGIFAYLFTLNFFGVGSFFMMLLFYFLIFGVPVVFGIVLLKIYKNRKAKINNERFMLRYAECISLKKTGKNSYLIEFNNGQKCRTSFDVFSSTSIGDKFYLLYIEGLGRVAELYQDSRYMLSDELKTILVV